MSRFRGSGIKDSAGDICVYLLDCAGQLPANNDEKRRPAGVDERIHSSAPAPGCKLQRTELIDDDKVHPFGRGHIKCMTAEYQSLFNEVERPDVARIIPAHGQWGSGFTSQVQCIESDKMSVPVD